MNYSACTRTNGLIDLDAFSSNQLWNYIMCVINSYSDEMKLLLRRFGVKKMCQRLQKNLMIQMSYLQPSKNSTHLHLFNQNLVQLYWWSNR